MASYSDDFNRADGPLGANYTLMVTDGPSASVVSNRAQKNSTAGSVRYHYTGLALSSSHAIELNAYGHQSSGNYIGVYCSGTNSGADLSGYVFFVGNVNEWNLQSRNSAGVGTTIASGSTTLASGDLIRIERDDTSNDIVAKLNGTTITTQNNSLYSGLYGGFELSAAGTVEIDNLVGADLGPTFTTQPASVFADAGQSVTLTVAAVGSGTVTYQWQQWSGGAWANISGQTSTSLVRTAPSAGNADAYRCVATDSASSTNSLDAKIIVLTQNLRTPWGSKS
jgi:hypothetical protein